MNINISHQTSITSFIQSCVYELQITIAASCTYLKALIQSSADNQNSIFITSKWQCQLVL